MGEEYKRDNNIISTVPMSGTVCLHDDFEYGNQWNCSGFGDRASTEIQTEFSYSKGCALYLKGGSTGGAPNDSIRAYRRMFVLPKDIFTVEIIFQFVSPTYLKCFLVDVDYSYIGHYKYIGIQYYKTDSKWYIRPVSGLYTVIDNVARYIRWDQWNKLSWSFNVSTNKYINLIVNEHTYDLRAFSFEDLNTGLYSLFEISIEATTIDGNSVDFLLDEVNVFGRNS